jgi:hypothetical protein
MIQLSSSSSSSSSSSAAAAAAAADIYTSYGYQVPAVRDLHISLW